MSSSWFPFNFSFQSLTPPLSIQRRFISFVLKRSLGHLLKPGQLDINHIDAQIGNGFVEVKDLELDPAAFTSFLDNFPVRLQHGSLGSVTVRIPWPNPFTATIGLSVTDVNLSFILVESLVPVQTHNLAESVASVAETFIHDELTEREEEILRDSFHPDVVHHINARDDWDRSNLPGAIDPFLDRDHEHHVHEEPLESDPEGISIFATLIERLLSRFDFDAKGIKITLVQPDNCALSLHVEEVAYYTDSAKTTSTLPQSSKESQDGETRTAKISGLKLTLRDLRPPRPLSPVPSSATPVPTRPASPAAYDASDSEMDEETQLMMSQSILSLPPRDDPPSPAQSTSSSSSSLYHSIPSVTESSRVHTNASGITTEPEDRETIVFNMSDDISLRLTTPAIVQTGSPENHGSPQDARAKEKMHLNITMGLISIALQANDVRAILTLVNGLVPPKTEDLDVSNKGKEKAQSARGIFDILDCSIQLKGLVCLIVERCTERAADASKLQRFFSNPLVPPSLEAAYIRLHVHDIRMSAGTQIGFDTGSLAEINVMDISAFTFFPPLATTTDANNHSTPLLITDQHLSSSYHSPDGQRAGHSHPRSEAQKEGPITVFDVVDWTQEVAQHHGAGLRHWRTRVRQSITSPRSGGLSPLSERHNMSNAAIRVEIFDELLKGPMKVAVETAPIHVFLDLQQVPMIIQFLDEAIPSPISNAPPAPDEAPGPSSHNARSAGQYERSPAEALLLKELDLTYDYQVESSSVERPKVEESPSQKALAKSASNNPVDLQINVPLLRFEVRVPSPRNRQQRSGAFVLDLHSLKVALNPTTPGIQRRTRFQSSSRLDDEDEEGDEGWPGDWLEELNGKASLSVGFRRIVGSYACAGEVKAEALVSIGPVSSEVSNTDPNTSEDPSTYPLILIRSSESVKGRDSTILLSIPSVHIFLSKKLFDGLQYWADDLSQWVERCFAPDNLNSKPSSSGASRNPSLIGSRFFVNQGGVSRSSSEETSWSKDAKGETIVKAFVLQCFARLSIPVQSADGRATRSLDLDVLKIDALVELKPEGNDEMIVTLGVGECSLITSYLRTARHLVATSPLKSKRSTLPTVKIRFHSMTLPSTSAKESKVRVELSCLHAHFWSELEWTSDLLVFLKAPPGVFESVVPSERTKIAVKITETALQVTAPNQQSALVLSLSDASASTDLVSKSTETLADISIVAMSVLLIDNSRETGEQRVSHLEGDVDIWRGRGFAPIARVEDLAFHLEQVTKESSRDFKIHVRDAILRVFLCADSIAGIGAFAASMQSLAPQDASPDPRQTPKRPTTVLQTASSSLMNSLDEQAFRRVPVIGPLPDMINDDLPTNPEYLDTSFGAAAGLRVLDDDDLDEFYPEDVTSASQTADANVTRFGGETIKILSAPIQVIENYYDTLPPVSVTDSSEYGQIATKVRVENCDLQLLLFDGYDWARTRKMIQNERKNMKKKLAKIRQLLANGQTYDPDVDEVNTVLFNSVYVGLDQDAEGLENDALIAAIDKELNDDDDASSESSWQSFKPGPVPLVKEKVNPRSKSLGRARGPSIEFMLSGLNAEFDQYHPGATAASRVLFTIKDLEILDHMRTSTWSKFLTQLRKDLKGNIRESDSNMVKAELLMLLPYQGHKEQEARLKAKILPLRLHVDQDALDFLKRFFSFKDPDALPSPPPENEIFFQHAEVFPVDIKLDYKPRRVDYRALREGRTIELMNFFHFDGAEMTLRHITLKGITGWARFFDSLNDLWTPDVKANQLVDVISGVSPIRSAVNVGSGVADLVLLPIAQYKKDGRIIRGLQKGGNAFVKSTAMEALKLGAQLATGTQVVLEHAENVLGGNHKGPVTAETLQTSPRIAGFPDELSDEEAQDAELISKYAEQPTNLREGVQSAYKTLARNIKSAGQTILAVPMEVYERSGSEGPARAVIRAVPIAVLKPMIGASEAVSKTLLGLRNTLDPNNQLDTEAKYKQR